MALNEFLEGLVLSASAVQMLKDSDEQRGMELHIVELMDEHGAPMDPEAFIVTALPPDEVLSTPDPKRVNSMMSQSIPSAKPSAQESLAFAVLVLTWLVVASHELSGHSSGG